MKCTGCGDELAEVAGLGAWAWCAVERRCLACCSDFVAHCSDVAKYEAEADAWLKGALADAEAEVEVGLADLGA